MDKTVLDLEEVTEIANNDYIVIDSVDGGPCKILATDFISILNGGV